MPKTATSTFTDQFSGWLTSEGFSVNRDRDSACMVAVDPSKATWGLSLRVLDLDLWTLVVVFDPAGDHEEIFYDLDAHPRYVTQLLANQLVEVWHDDPTV